MQELASDPLACRPALSFLPKASSGVRNGDWILGADFGGIFRKMHCSAVWRLQQKIHKTIRTQNPHTQLKNPRQKSAPKIRPKNPPQNPNLKSPPRSAPKTCTKIRAQALNQYPQRPTTKRAQGVSLELHFVATCAGLREQKKSHQKSVVQLRGKLGGKKLALKISGEA